MVSCKVYAMDCLLLRVIEPEAYATVSLCDCVTLDALAILAPNFASWFSRQNVVYIGIKK